MRYLTENRTIVIMVKVKKGGSFGKKRENRKRKEV